MEDAPTARRIERADAELASEPARAAGSTTGATLDWEAFYREFRKPGFIPGYEIQNRLGGGAFGDVYKAQKSSIGKTYAVKFLKVDDESQRDVIERELDQVRHFAAIDHPNLVTIEDMGVAGGVPYLIMGYAGEDTLARRLRRTRLEPQTALAFFVQTCRGVLALHDRRLVHFDLKPSNVFLKGDVARVGDYGLAKLMAEGHQTLSFGRGTPQYMAPEMLQSRADHRADVYSLGVILFESVSAKVPFPTDGGIARREPNESAPFPADFPAELRPAVERCLAYAPEARFQSVGELLVALGQASRQGDSIVFPVERREPPSDASAPAPRSPGRHAHDAAEEARAVWERLRRSRAAEPAPPSGGDGPSTPSAGEQDAAGGPAGPASPAGPGAHGGSASGASTGSATAPAPARDAPGPEPTLGAAAEHALEAGREAAAALKEPLRRGLEEASKAGSRLTARGRTFAQGLVRLFGFLLFMGALGAALTLFVMALGGGLG